jgi:hypothetical protein
MGKFRRTEITIETERLLIISRNTTVLDCWCEGCERKSRLLSVGQAARSVGLSLRELCRLVEACEIHFFETENGELFICFDSLTKHSSKDG